MTKTVQELMRQSGVPFGTSGARGLDSAMTDRVCYGYVWGFLSHLSNQGLFHQGGEVALAGDLRPSTPRILSACATAVRDFGGTPIFCGYIPSPALALYAFSRAIPSLMVTGSHIPADRNGIKFYRPDGEVLKEDEFEIGRQTLYFGRARFDLDGCLIAPEELPALKDVEGYYFDRYVSFFGPNALSGKRIGVYQHSAVGRDLLARILVALGAEVELLGRSKVFVPVDTEAVRPLDIAQAEVWGGAGRYDAIVSTDGDSDRPLMTDERGKWLRGDILGILCANWLGAQCVVAPISCNSAVEASGRFARVVRTQIGSPYVIAAMNKELRAGSAPVVGYEANGGFLLGSPIRGKHCTLEALPTRDALLPMLAVLVNSELSVSQQVAALPQRFTHSNVIAPFPVEASQILFDLLTKGDEAAQLNLQTRLFGKIAGPAEAIDHTDGVRTRFAIGGVVHFRRSGNAPELRCYTECGSESEAMLLNASAVEEVKLLLESQPTHLQHSCD